MQDVNTLRGWLNEYRDNDAPKLESMRDHDECDVSRKSATLFLFFMLCTTTVYMAWNVYEVSRLRQQVQSERDERNANKSRAGQVIDEMLKLKTWSKETK
jgi:hypothetical protein